MPIAVPETRSDHDDAVRLVLATLGDIAPGEVFALVKEPKRERRRGRGGRRERIVGAGVHLVLALHDEPRREPEASGGRLPGTSLSSEDALIFDFYSKHQGSRFLASDLWFSVASRLDECGRTDVACGLLDFLARFPKPESDEMRIYRRFTSETRASKPRATDH